MGKIGHLGADLFKMMSRDFPHFIAARTAGAAKAKDAANLFRGKPKLPRPPNEAKGAHVLFAVDAVTSSGA